MQKNHYIIDVQTAAVAAAMRSTFPIEEAEHGCYWSEGGTVVAFQAYTLRRDPVIFPDSERFDSARWVTPTKEMKDVFFERG
jgi:cytochrome P450